MKESSNLLADAKVEIEKDVMRDLIEESALTFENEAGDIEMLLTMDMPIDDIHNQPVIVAQAKVPANLKERKVGVCDAIPNMGHARDAYEESPLSPIATAGHYLWLYEFKADQKSELEQGKIRSMLMAMEKDATVQVIQSPKHGVLSEVPHITYLQGEQGYFGKDRVVIVVKMGDYKITLNYIIKYINAPIGNAQEGESTYCDRSNPYHMWKLSEAPDYLPTNITFHNLTGAAVGETTGEGADASIILDTNAAGHSWYQGGMYNFGGLGLDANFISSLSPTLYPKLPSLPSAFTLSRGARGFNDMSNRLSTSNPNVWVASTGTAAASINYMMPTASNMAAHENHFHIYLQPPKVKPIDHSRNLIVDNAILTNGALGKKTITPKIIEEVNWQNRDLCISVEHPRYNYTHPERVGGFDGMLAPALDVAASLTANYKIPIVTPLTSKIIQQPAHGKIVSLEKNQLDKIEGENAGFIRPFDKVGNLIFEKFKYIPNNDAFHLDPKKDVMGEDHVKFEVTVNGKKFTVSYLIRVSDIYNGRECLVDDEESDIGSK